MRIMIIGSGGSGKSTFARKLEELTKLPLIHLDTHFWRPGWDPTPEEEWDQFLTEITQRKEWIIDGNYSRTMDIRMRAADVIIFFDLPPLLNLYRVFKRRLQYHGRTRPDMNEGCPERLDWEFMKWVWNYRRTRRPAVEQKLAGYSKEKRIITIKKTKEASDLLYNVRVNGLSCLNPF